MFTTIIVMRGHANMIDCKQLNVSDSILSHACSPEFIPGKNNVMYCLQVHQTLAHQMLKEQSHAEKISK